MSYVKIIMIVMLLSLQQSLQAAEDLEDGVKDLASQIAKTMIAKSKKKLAVIEITDLNNVVNPLGQFLAEELITQLFKVNPDKFEVVERRQLAKVLKQQKLSMTGLLEPSAMQSVGKILGVDAIVTGSMTDLGNTIKINARMIAIDSARILGVASTNIPKVGMVTTLLTEPNLSYGNTNLSSASTLNKTRTPQSKFSQTITAGEFEFSVKSCKISGSELYCSLIIENKGTNKVLQLLGANAHSFVVDGKGNQYLANLAILGSHKHYEAVKETMIKDVPVKAGAKFSNVDESITYIKAFKLGALGLSDVIFKDVPVTRTQQ